MAVIFALDINLSPSVNITGFVTNLAPMSADDRPWMEGMISRIFLFYYDGFRSMVVGRTLWKLILVKLFIMFAILKVFFFPDVLKTNFDTDADRAEHVLQNLIRNQSDED